MEQKTQQEKKGKWRIKYADHKGNVYIEVIFAYNRVDVGRRLSHPVKEVYWIKKEAETHLPNIKK